jgi:multidrug efflux pump subunit AcrA (membrane-fusion protein)
MSAMNLRTLFPSFRFDADAGGGSGAATVADATPPVTDPAPPAAADAPPVTESDAPADSRPAPSQADIDKAYAKLRAAEAERDKLKAEADKRAEAEMTELDKAKKRADDLERLAAEATGKVRRANLVAGLSNPARGIAPDAVDLVASAIDVEFDDADKPADLDAAVEAFLSERPSLRARSGSPATSPGNPDAGRRKGAEMTSAEIAKLATSDPTRFNELFERGEIPRSALSGD